MLSTSTQLISFLQLELGVSEAEIALATAKGESTNLLPMILWQHGLLTTEQLVQAFDWLETVNSKITLDTAICY